MISAWGLARTVKPGTVIPHSRGDDVIPFEESLELVRASGGPLPVLENADRPIAVLHVPDTATPGTIDCIAVVRDDGEPVLTRYARAVVTVTADRAAADNP
jgi:hypothetical protein